MGKRWPPQTLKDLVSIGPAALKDFEVLGIETLEQLAQCDARSLYEKLGELTSGLHDPCVEDVFSAAIAQAKDPTLPKEQRVWHYYSRVRKGDL